MKYIKLVVEALLPFIGGNLIGKYAVKNARKDYRQNVKPPLSPPGYIFSIVWPVLYVSMGVAFVTAKYNLRGAAVVESFVLFTAVTSTTATYFQTNKTSGSLMVPYVAWSGYASYLATGNWLLNKDKAHYTNN